MNVIIGWCLLGGARAASKSGAFWRAVRFLGAAETRLNINRDLNFAERVEYERDVADLRAQLGEANFSAARNEGYEMTPRKALTALESPIALEPLTEPKPPTSPSIGSPSTKAPSYPAGLTTREVEVLRLVAQGLSNAEIAEQLIISLLTVKAHMRSLYNKLGISSRSAATRYAIEHHLL